MVFIAREEGFEPEVYEDLGGLRTIGFGHLLLGGETIKGPLTREEGLGLLRTDISERVQPGLNLITADLNQNQVNAVGSLIFNVGIGNFGKSRSLGKLNAGDFAGFNIEAAEFRLVNGKRRPSLEARRAREKDLFNKKGGGE